jgi:putative ABC transport system permease protein
LIGPVVSGTEAVSVETQSAQVVVVQGVPPNFAQISGWQTDQGRFLAGQDDASLDRVAVVDESLARQLFPGSAAIGASIRIRDIPFTIVGVGSDPRRESVVLVPLRTAQIRLFGPAALNAIMLRVSSEAEANSVSQQTEALLRTRHNLRANQPDDFTISAAALSSHTENAITGKRVLQVIQQFVCPAKNTCPRNAA